MDNYVFNDEPKYKKKAKHAAVQKAKHKHDFQPCVFEYINKIGRLDKQHGFVPERATKGGWYCPICGKIGAADNFTWFEWVPLRGKIGRYEYTPEAKKQLDPKTRTLPTFWLDDEWHQKFVSL